MGSILGESAMLACLGLVGSKCSDFMESKAEVARDSHLEKIEPLTFIDLATFVRSPYFSSMELLIMSDESDNPEASKKKTNPNGEGGVCARILESFRWLISGVLENWKQAIILAVSGAIVAIVSSAWLSGKEFYKLYFNAINDQELVLKYARITPIGHKIKAIKAFFDVNDDRQYIAILYRGDDSDAYVQAFQIIEGAPLAVGKAIPVIGPIDCCVSPPHIEVFFPQKWRVEFSQSSVQTEEEELSTAQNYFGFADVDGDIKLEMYSVWVHENTGGSEGRIFVTKLDDGKIFQVRDSVRISGAALNPQFSENVTSEKVRAWLLAKKNEVLEPVGNWARASESEFSNGLREKPNNKELDEKWLGTYARQWFEANGKEATTGIMKMIQIPKTVISEDEVNHSMCSLLFGQDTWFIVFKGPIMKLDSSSGKIFLAYMPDPYNHREPLGIIEGKDFLWFAVDLFANDKHTILAMRKSDEEFIGVPMKFVSDDVTESGSVVEEDGTEDQEVGELFNLDAGMPSEPDMKDGTLQYFKYEAGVIKTDINGFYSLSDSRVSVDSHNIEIDVKAEFDGAKNCIDKSE